MRLKKNKTNWTLYIDHSDELIIYAHPYITDGHAIFNLLADNISVRLPAGLHGLKPNMKNETDFRATLTDEGFAITAVEATQVEALTRIFDLAGVVPLVKTPFIYADTQLYTVADMATGVVKTNGIPLAYADALIGNEAMCQGPQHPIVAFRTRAKLGRKPMAAIMPTVFDSADEDTTKWLNKLAAPEVE